MNCYNSVLVWDAQSINLSFANSLPGLNTCTLQLHKCTNYPLVIEFVFSIECDSNKGLPADWGEHMSAPHYSV